MILVRLGQNLILRLSSHKKGNKKKNLTDIEVGLQIENLLHCKMENSQEVSLHMPRLWKYFHLIVYLN